jgi:hypothetical protein
VLLVVVQALVDSMWNGMYRLRAACNCRRSSMML